MRCTECEGRGGGYNPGEVCGTCKGTGSLRFVVLPVVRGDADPELTCIFCNVSKCEGEIPVLLPETGYRSWFGIHEKCLQRHEALRGVAVKEKAT